MEQIIKKMNDKELNVFMRFCIFDNDESHISLCENEFEDRYYFDIKIKLSRVEDCRYKNISVLRKEIEEFKREFDYEFVRKARERYLEEAVKSSKEEYKKVGNDMTSFMNKIEKYFDAPGKLVRNVYRQRLEDSYKKYKKLYSDYGIVKGDLFSESYSSYSDAFVSEDVVIRCREIPIETFISGNIINAGPGRKKCLCPFHNEKTPSFVIYSKDNSFHCFGCEERGNNAIDFIIKEKSLEFSGAVNYLKSMV